MSGDSDLMKLYSTRILALAANIPHRTRLDAPDATAHRRAPLCGSNVTVDLTVSNGTITGYGQDVKACALGQASASVIGAQIIGQSRADVQAGRDQLAAMLSQGAPSPLVPFDELEVLRAAADFKNRHGSILLTFDAILDAFDTLNAS